MQPAATYLSSHHGYKPVLNGHIQENVLNYDTLIPYITIFIYTCEILNQNDLLFCYFFSTVLSSSITTWCSKIVNQYQYRY